jgi:hypothetical protein
LQQQPLRPASICSHVQPADAAPDAAAPAPHGDQLPGQPPAVRRHPQPTTPSCVRTLARGPPPLPHLAVHLDQALHQDGLDLLAGQRIPASTQRRGTQRAAAAPSVSCRCAAPSTSSAAIRTKCPFRACYTAAAFPHPTASLSARRNATAAFKPNTGRRRGSSAAQRHAARLVSHAAAQRHLTRCVYAARKGWDRCCRQKHCSQSDLSSLEAVAQHQQQRQALPLLVGAGRRLGGLRDRQEKRSAARTLLHHLCRAP